MTSQEYKAAMESGTCQTDGYLFPKQTGSGLGLSLIGFAVNCCVYNEEKTIGKLLMSITEKLKGINFIFILDGAWEQPNISKSASTDLTKEIVKRLAKEIKKQYGIHVIWADPPFEQPFKTQSQKRNHAFARVENIIKTLGFQENWYHLTMDGDETIHFGNGWEKLNLQADGSDFPQLWPKVGLIKAFGKGGGHMEFMQAARFIPAKQGYHYHTEKRVCLHDKNCQTIHDFWADDAKINEGCELCDQFFIINDYEARGHERLEQKKEYIKQEKFDKGEPAACKHNNTLRL